MDFDGAGGTRSEGDDVAAFKDESEAIDSRAPDSGQRRADLDMNGIVSAVLADHARLADPAIVSAVAALPELDGARIVSKLKAAKVRAKDLDTFAAKVKSARKDAERRAEEARSRARPPTWRDDLARSERGEVLSTFPNLCTMLENLYRGRLGFDCMAQRPCLDGAPVGDRDVSKVRRNLGNEGANFGKEDIGDAMGLVGGELAEIHPVRDYLTRCREQWDGKPRLDSAAVDLLGVRPDDTLSRVMVRRTIIAAAARGLRPGCKVDTILVLLGHQGARKSTFFRVLGGMWFGDSKVDITDRKGQMVMASRWIYEWPEVDRVFAKHSDSDIKAFVSQQADDFVPMYGRAVANVPRSWLAVGTTNRPKFLTDVTGDRRVWPVDLRSRGVDWKIDANKVEAVRDHLFGEAAAEVAAYYEAQAQGVPDDANPHRWFLNDAEEAERAKRAREFHVENAWCDTVGRWLAGEPIKCSACKGTGNGIGRDREGEPHSCAVCRGRATLQRGPISRTETGREYVTTSEVLSEALGIPAERHKQHGTTIADTLAELGWVGGERIRLSGGRKVTPYYSPHVNSDAADPCDDFPRE